MKKDEIRQLKDNAAMAKVWRWRARRIDMGNRIIARDAMCDLIREIRHAKLGDEQ